jgi:hypothetical protein
MKMTSSRLATSTPSGHNANRSAAVLEAIAYRKGGNLIIRVFAVNYTRI